MKRALLTLFLIFVFCFPAKAFANFENFSTVLYESEHNGKNDKYHLDGSRKTMLAVPVSSRPDDVTLVVWFHGLNGFSEKTFSRIFSQVERLSEEGSSIAVLVPEMPWSTMTKTPRSRQGKVWRKKDQFRKFLDEALTLLGKTITEIHGLEVVNPRIIVVGHSAGGSAIASASSEGSLCDDRITHVVWSDASYGRWLEKAHQGCLKNSEIIQKVFVRKWDSPHKNALAFYKKYPAVKNHEFVVLNRKKYTHGKIGNLILELSKLFPPGC